MRQEKYNFINLENSTYKEYKIKIIRKGDIQKIRKWRNEQIDVLRQTKKISTLEQNKYYEDF